MSYTWHDKFSSGIKYCNIIADLSVEALQLIPQTRVIQKLELQFLRRTDEKGQISVEKLKI